METVKDLLIILVSSSLISNVVLLSLIHIYVSQISKEHIEKPSDVLKVGDEVTAKVVDFNEADKKISLSVKALLAPEPAKEAEKEDEDVVSVDIDAVIANEEN